MNTPNPLLYLDHNATSPLRPEARAAWLEVADRLAGNPSSLHAGGRWARDQIDLARERVAAALGVDEDELTFTSGGTESNNAALLGALGSPASGRAFITDRGEHASVLEVADRWEAAGGSSRRTGLDPEGLPDLGALARAVGAVDASVVAVFAANNETGAVPDFAAVRATLEDARRGPVALHVDAVQALGKLDLPSILPHADTAAFSAHKVGGPTGVGLLWCRHGTALGPLLVGGGQESGRRAGTENTASIVAASIAIELAVAERSATAARMRTVADTIRAELARALPRVRLLGPVDPARRLPNTLALLVPDNDGKVLVTRLDLEGLAVGAGSACASGSIGASHVLLAMGLDENDARAALRLSLGRTTTIEEGKRAVAILRKVLAPSDVT